MNEIRIEPSELVLSVLALNPVLNESVMEGRLSENYLTSRICSRYLSRTLNDAGIRPNEQHGDSSKLNHAITQLVQRGILLRNSPALRWDFPLTPEEYFKSNIECNISEYLVKQLDEFSRTLN